MESRTWCQIQIRARQFYGVIYFANAIAVIDTHSKRVKSLFRVGTGPTFAANLAEHQLLLVDTNNTLRPLTEPSTILVIDLRSHRVSRRLSLGIPAFAPPVVSSDRKVAYLASPQEGMVLGINVKTLRVVSRIRVMGQPTFMALDPGHHSLFVTTIKGDSLDRIDTSSDKVTAVIHLAGGPAPFALSADGKDAYVATASGLIEGVDLREGTIRWKLRLPGGYASRVTADMTTHRLYAAIPGSQTIDVIDLTRHRIVRQLRTHVRGDVVSILMQ